MFRITLITSLLLTLLTPLAFAEHGGSHKVKYRVVITNLTAGQTFTPILMVAHNPRVSLFEIGAPASEELSILAEGGDTAPLTEVLQGFPRLVKDVVTIDGLLAPGNTTTMIIKTTANASRLSLAAMLIPSNDTFVALDSIALPRWGSRKVMALAYDAGSEFNDQSCANIPGPRCGGEGVSEAADSDEGFVHVSNGFHDLGDMDMNGAEVLKPAGYDWRNPVARVSIRRISQ